MFDDSSAQRTTTGDTKPALLNIMFGDSSTNTTIVDTKPTDSVMVFNDAYMTPTEISLAELNARIAALIEQSPTTHDNDELYESSSDSSDSSSDTSEPTADSTTPQTICTMTLPLQVGNTSVTRTRSGDIHI